MSRTILVVDDDPMIRRLIATTLGDSGFSLREAGNGEEALESALEDRPEIVLLDYEMPGLDGVETCRRLRSDPVTADATIVMLTGYSDVDAERRATGAGADHFLAKPFSPLHLLRLVDTLAGGR